MSAPTAAAPPETVHRGVAWSLATQLATSVGTAVLTLFLVHQLGPEHFGVFALAVSIATLVLVPSDLGLSVSTARFVGAHTEDRSRLATVLAEGLRLKLLAGMSVTVALVALAGPIAGAYDEPGLATPLRWMALAIFAQGLLVFYRGVFGALRRQSVAFQIVASESVAETGASIALVLLGLGVVGASAGRAIGFGFGAAVAFALTLRAFGRGVLPFERRGSGELRRGIASYAGSLFVLDLAFSLSSQLAPLLIAGFFSAASVGLFQAPSRLIVFLQYPGLSVANAVAPRLARTGDEVPDFTDFSAALRRLIAVQGLLMAPLLAWATPITHLLFGEKFAGSAPLLRGVAPYVFMAGLTPVVTLSLSFLGLARTRIKIALVAIVLEVALMLTLLPTLGLIGAVVASDISAAFFTPVHLWVMRRHWGLRLRPFVVAGARMLVAAAAATLLLVALGTDELAPWQWAAGIVGAPIVYVAVLAALGEISPDDRRRLARRLRRKPQASE